MLSNAAQILAENSILKWDPRPEDCRSPVIADLYRTGSSAAASAAFLPEPISIRWQ
jgi:hypothetical protein